MTGPYCSIDGRLVPVEHAVIPIDDVNFQYGYGVYESLKVRNGILFFADRHEERLFHSARIIGLEHTLGAGMVQRYTRELLQANTVQDANIKQLLIGAPASSPGTSAFTLYIMVLNPLFPDRKLYRDGCSVICFDGERQWPEAKSLNMLTSTIAYRAARAAGAYDALLVDRNGYVTEGTRTNLYITDGRSVQTAPSNMVLPGVTRSTVNEVIAGLGIPIVERPFSREEMAAAAGCFLTSTSSKVMPVTSVDAISLEIPELVRTIRRAYDDYLSEYVRKAGSAPGQG